METSVSPAWREIFADFLLMLLVGIGAGAIHELRVSGRSISGILVDACGIAALYALLRWAIRSRHEESTGSRSPDVIEGSSQQKQ